MYQDIKKNWGKAKLLILFAITITLLLLLTVVYKSDQKITKKSELIKDFNEKSDLKKFKKFLLNQIKSPFINLDYEINKGDTIQKILRKYKVQNSEIQTVINQYKRFGKPNQLLVGQKIDIIIKKELATKKKLYNKIFCSYY